MTQELICDFKYEGWQFLKKTYTCVIKNQKFENFELNLQGKHLNELSNKDVSAVFLIKCSMEKIPIFTKIFPNMKHLMILMSDLSCIESDDFKEYTQLTQLYMTKIEITFMPKNLFENLKNLKILSLFDIKVDLIEPEIFDDMNQLEIVELYNCGFKNMLYSVYNSNPGNASLEDIKNEIFLKYQKTYWKKISKELLKDEALNEIKIILPQIMKENKITENLKLSDVSSITFCAVMNFTLNNELPTSNDINFIHLLIISEKFKIKELAEHAAKMLFNQISNENVFEIFTLCEEYDHKELRKKAFQELKKIHDDNGKFNTLIKRRNRRSKKSKVSKVNTLK